MKIIKIAVIGKTNAGKSTLCNQFAQGFSAISKKKNTSRRILMWVWEKIDEGKKIFLLDAPGIIKPRTVLEKMMFNNLKEVVQAVDLIWWVVDIDDSLVLNLIDFKKILGNLKKPTVIILNKTDKMNKEGIWNKINEWSWQEDIFWKVVPVSAKNKHNFNKLIEATFDSINEIEKKHQLLKTPCKDNFSLKLIEDQNKKLKKLNENVLIKEIVREQIMNLTNEEVPYETGIVLKKIEEDSKRKIVWLIFYVNRLSQKIIILGKQGEKIGEIRRNAEAKLKKAIKKNVILSFEIKVEKNWFKKKEIIQLMDLQTNYF